MTPRGRLKRYLLTGPIGVGNVGLLLSSISENDGQRWALHVPYLRYQQRLGFGARYLSDALWAATSGLSGFSLPVLCDCTDELVFSAQPVVRGSTLEALIRHMRARPLRMNRRLIVTIALPVARALHSLHSAGGRLLPAPPCHGRLSARRVMITHRGEVVVLGMPAPGGWQDGPWLTPLESGRLCEIPPELLEGQPLTPAADVYLVALLIYTMWLMHNPHDQPTRRATLLSVLSGAPRLRDSMHLGGGLRELLLTGLSESPDQRPTMERLIAILEETAEEEGGVFPPETLRRLLETTIPAIPRPPSKLIHTQDAEMLLSLLQST